jgi:hypothetical protein
VLRAALAFDVSGRRAIVRRGLRMMPTFPLFSTHIRHEQFALTLGAPASFVGVSVLRRAR